MKKKTLLFFGLVATLLASILLDLSTDQASGAEKRYPSSSVELFCAFTAGGQSDLLSRVLAKGLEKYLNVPVIPGNKPGGGGTIVGSYLANAPPDGYTLGTLGESTLITAFLLGQANYSREDFRIVGQFAFVSNVLAVSADSQWKTVQELIDYGRKNPGLTYAHPGVGVAPFLRGEYFNKIANMKMRGVPFKGEAEAMTAVLGKHIPVGFFGYTAAKSQADAGKIRILFSFDPPGIGPDPTLPNIPGIFGKDVFNIGPPFYYLVAPKKTPEEVIQVLGATLEKITKDQEFIDNLRKLHVAVQLIDGTTLLRDKVLEERAVKFTPILKESGLIK